jgi:hypothetical protein
LVRAVKAGERDAELRAFFDRAREVDRFEAFRERVDAAVRAATDRAGRGR